MDLLKNPHAAFDRAIRELCRNIEGHNRELSRINTMADCAPSLRAAPHDNVVMKSRQIGKSYGALLGNRIHQDPIFRDAFMQSAGQDAQADVMRQMNAAYLNALNQGCGITHMWLDEDIIKTETVRAPYL
jgi:hypothetical protein